MNIAIFSCDNFLISFLRKNLVDLNITICQNAYEGLNYSEYSIFILDLLDKQDVEYIIDKINLNFSLIININKFRLNNAINIDIPFKISILKDHVETYIDYLDKYCIFDIKFKLNINKNIISINNKNIQLTEKECLLMKTLYEKNKVYKDDLLKIVCGYDNSRAIETLIYNIRFKLKNNNVEDFITCKNGYYELNLL